MRKIISILLLFSLIVYMGGYHLVVALYRSALKQEMRAYLNSHKDERFGTYLSFQEKDHQVTDPQFEWEEVDEEFSYLGEMYDVVSVKHENGQILICALKDTRENDLGKQVSEIRHSTKDPQHAPGQHLLKFFSAFCIWTEQNTDQIVEISMIKYNADAYSYPMVNIEMSSPPPDYFFKIQF